MKYRFIFRNAETGELRTKLAPAMNHAARSAGIDVSSRGPIPAPWQPWECWQGDFCIWHFNDNGECLKGERK